MKQYLAIRDLAKVLTISVPTLYRWTSEKQIPHVRIGGRIFFDPETIDKWIEGCAVEVLDKNL